LKELEFELLEDQKQKQIEATKNLLLKKYNAATWKNISASANFSLRAKKDYNNITRFFLRWKALPLSNFYPSKIEKSKRMVWL